MANTLTMTTTYLLEHKLSGHQQDRKILGLPEPTLTKKQEGRAYRAHPRQQLWKNSLFNRVNGKFCSKTIINIIRYHTAIYYIMSMTSDWLQPYWVSSGG